MQRRTFLIFGITAVTVGLVGYKGIKLSQATEEGFSVKKTSSEWKQALTPEQYNVMREHGTERPFTSEYLDEKRKGVYVCAACSLPLFYTDAKFDSGTGWPSFDRTIKGNIKTTTDYKLIAPRTEYHCARCGSHMGHVFDDGPTETGERYCNNGIALRFVPADTPEYAAIVKEYPPEK
jgi:peptide-methionine (R)-S-oxide reductase